MSLPIRTLLYCFGYSYLVLAGQVACAQNTVSTNIILKRTSPADLVRTLRSYGVRVNFIEPEYSRKDGLTIAARIGEISQIASADRTDTEQAELKALEGSSQNGEGSLIIGYPYKRSDFKLMASSDLTSLQGAITNFLEASYPYLQIIQSNESLVIAPKTNSEFDRKASFRLSSIKPTDAVPILRTLLQSHKVRLINSDKVDHFLSNLTGLISLEIVDQPLPIILTRFVESCGGGLTWTVAGREGYRNLYFTLPSKEK